MARHKDVDMTIKERKKERNVPCGSQIQPRISSDPHQNRIWKILRHNLRKILKILIKVDPEVGQMLFSFKLNLRLFAWSCGAAQNECCGTLFSCS